MAAPPVVPSRLAAAVGFVAALRRATAFGSPPSIAARGRAPSLHPSRDRVGPQAAGRGDPLGTILDLFGPPRSLSPASIRPADEGVVTSFVDAINSRADPSDMIRYFSDDVRYVDASFYSPVEGTDALLRHFYLHAGSSPLSTLGRDSSDVIVVDDVVSSAAGEDGGDGTAASRVCVMYHLASAGGERLPDTTGITFYNLEGGKIVRVFDATEPLSPKPADFGLKLLGFVSDLIGDDSIAANDVREGVRAKDGPSSAPERYFDAWNRRDVDDAASLFAEDCVVRDLQYPDAFRGREEFASHLARVNGCLPGSFDFVVDDVALSATKAGVLWHVENDGAPLAFTRGCSFYTIDGTSGLISTGFEIPEKAPPKLGYLRTLASRFEAEPVRYVPLALWVAYMYVLFVSDGILPGANALALERRTWEEVRDLSLNFFLVAPALKLPFSPVVHPMLEGVFNLLLSWAAMFAGFLSDERRDKPNLLPFGPMLVGMQFLTSGFLLPYLFARTPEMGATARLEDVDGEVQRLVAEWRPLGPLLGGVGTASVLWGLYARPDFGNVAERYSSFLDLLSIDRVGSSFIVDLVIFAAFQGWFVDDDLRRRGVADDDLGALRNAAKFVPFLGLAAYLVLRPPLPSRESGE